MICDQNFRIKKGDCVRVKCHEQFKSGVVFIVVNSPVSISQNNKVRRAPDLRQIIIMIWNDLWSKF